MSSNPYDSHDPYGAGSGDQSSGDGYGSQPSGSYGGGSYGSQPNDPYGQNSSYGQDPNYGQSPYGDQSPFGGQPGQAATLTTEADYRQMGIKPPMSEPLYGASMMTAYTRFWKKYVRFKGYASKSEYWWPFLINNIILFVLMIPFFIGTFMTAAADSSSSVDPYATTSEPSGAAIGLMSIGGILMFIFSLAILLPTLSAGWRRIQDAGMAGPLIFLNFVPYVGGLITIILCVMPTKLDKRRPEWADTTGD